MQKIISTCLVFFLLTQAFGQKKITTCLSVDYNKTISDVTIGNNPSGIGLGLQTFFNTKTKFKPTIELTADTYLEDDKVFRINADGTPMNDVRGMVNLFAGTSFFPVKNVFLSFVAGPSFISGQTLLGIKPSLGFYFSKTKRWTVKVSYINIFDRDKVTMKDFGSLNFAIGLKLF